MATPDASLLIHRTPGRMFGSPPAEGDYKYSMHRGYLFLILLSPRALRWFQDEVYSDAFQWLSPTEPVIPWGSGAGELLREMRHSGLRKARG